MALDNVPVVRNEQENEAGEPGEEEDDEEEEPENGLDVAALPPRVQAARAIIRGAIDDVFALLYQ